MPNAPSTADRLNGVIPPPPGQTANLINPPNHDADWIALHTVCLVLITFFVGMRLGIRWLVVHSLGWDDLFVALTWATSVGFSAIMLKTLDYGLGRHLWDVPKEHILPLGEWLFISEIVARPTWLCLKNAFFLTYLRVFSPSKLSAWLCYIGIFVCSGLYFAETIHTIFICIPVQKNWDNALPGHCLPNEIGGSITGIFNVISDFYVLLLPIPFVWRLQMKIRPKLRLMALFGMGAAVNAISLTRLVLTYTTAGSVDVSMRTYTLSILITLEIDIGLVAICALVLPAFWERVLSPQWSRFRSFTRTPSRFHSSTRSSSRFHSNEGTVAAPEDPEYGLKLMQTEGKHSMTTLESSVKEAHGMGHNREVEDHAEY